MMSTQLKRLQLAVHAFVCKEYENKLNLIGVADDMIHLIAKFAKRFFDSQILSKQQDLTLVQLLSTNLTSLYQQQILSFFT